LPDSSIYFPAEDLTQPIVSAAGRHKIARQSAAGLPFSLIADRAGFLGWALALLLAAAGEVAVVTGQPFERARVLFLLAMVVALVSSVTWPTLPRCGTRRYRVAPLAFAAGLPLGRQDLAGWTRLFVLAGGALLALGAVPLTASRVYAPAATVWLLGITLIAVACVFRTRPRISRPSASTMALIAITLGTFALRVVNLTSLPPEVHGDEAAIGNDARRLLSGEQPNLFGLGWYQIDEISFGISAAFMRLFGNNLFGLRIAAVVQGTLSVSFTFLLVQRLFNLRMAIMAACLLSVAEIHVHYSRTGFHYIQACFTTVLLLYMLVRALDRRGFVDYVLLGLVGGLSLLV
jgi:Dolichyl-phosphate-mannose-protein mannosyltransferase